MCVLISHESRSIALRRLGDHPHEPGRGSRLSRLSCGWTVETCSLRSSVGPPVPSVRSAGRAKVGRVARQCHGDGVPDPSLPEVVDGDRAADHRQAARRRAPVASCSQPCGRGVEAGTLRRDGSLRPNLRAIRRTRGAPARTPIGDRSTAARWSCASPAPPRPGVAWYRNGRERLLQGQHARRALRVEADAYRSLRPRPTQYSGVLEMFVAIHGPMRDCVSRSTSCASS